MKDELEQILKEAREELTGAQSSNELEELRVKFLGKKGLLTSILRRMGSLPPEERPIIGRLANEARETIEDLLASRRAEIAAEETRKRFAAEAIDVTLPGTPIPLGSKHPLTLIREEIERIFIGMGFTVVGGPDIESDYYNFEALNIPKDHPARDMQDSFYIGPDLLLRTQTSPVQIRTMERTAPKVPLRVIAPGRVYRRDDDVTHSPVFHQVEGLAVDEGVTMGDLKGALLTFAREMYGEGTRIRLRPSYFPFTEPSAEVDVSCSVCGGRGCRTCSYTGWIEVLGCGMVHPQVLKNGGYDPRKVSGFAFGMGIERIAMLRYGIDDIRLFYENDLRFLRQFV